MTNLAVFFDTNIIMKNYKMSGNKFEDLFDFVESSDDRCLLALTEMNYDEIIEHFSREVNKVFNKLDAENRTLNRLINLDVTLNSNYAHSEIINYFASTIEDRFNIVRPTSEACYNVFSRYYERKKPFIDNKLEFKDAMIWETIYEFAITNSETTVYFVSENTNDFCQLSNNQYVLHEDFLNENNRIRFFDSIDALLNELDVIRPYYGMINNTVLETITEYFEDGYNVEEVLMEPVQYFLSQENFSGDYIEGWGVEPSDFTVSYDINTDKIFESNRFLYIPIVMEVTLNFSIQTLNPVYERGDEEFITESGHGCSLLVEFYISYNIKTSTISEFEEFSISFL